VLRHCALVSLSVFPSKVFKLAYVKPEASETIPLNLFVYVIFVNPVTVINSASVPTMSIILSTVTVPVVAPETARISDSSIEVLFASVISISTSASSPFIFDNSVVILPLDDKLPIVSSTPPLKIPVEFVTEAIAEPSDAETASVTVTFVAAPRITFVPAVIKAAFTSDSFPETAIPDEVVTLPVVLLPRADKSLATNVPVVSSITITTLPTLPVIFAILDNADKESSKPVVSVRPLDPTAVTNVFPFATVTASLMVIALFVGLVIVPALL